VGPANAKPSPFRREGLLRRTAPFLAAMALSYAAIRLPAVKRDSSSLIAAAALNLVIIGLVIALPWQKLPRSADMVPPLLYMVVVALLRDGLGGAISAYSTLLILPVLWFAMYGSRGDLAVGVTGIGVLLTMPGLLIGEPQYTDEEWRRALLWVTVSGIVGLAVQDLVEQVRQRAEALHAVSAARELAKHHGGPVVGVVIGAGGEVWGSTSGYVPGQWNTLAINLTPEQAADEAIARIKQIPSE